MKNVLGALFFGAFFIINNFASEVADQRKALTEKATAPSILDVGTSGSAKGMPHLYFSVYTASGAINSLELLD